MKIFELLTFAAGQSDDADKQDDDGQDVEPGVLSWKLFPRFKYILTDSDSDYFSFTWKPDHRINPEDADDGHGHHQLYGEDGVNLPDEAAPDALVPEVEASVGLAKHMLNPFLIPFIFKPVRPRGWSPRFRQPWPLLEKLISDNEFYWPFLQNIILIVLKDKIANWLRDKRGQRQNVLKRESYLYILNYNWREFSVNNVTEGSDRR